ncbi:MAG: sugar phosphate isomerase/epimerase [Chitinophagaceae bacterium]|nr:sugar phosphate isomerase/epimerase [Chitinophagaceae bacterium]
MQYDRRKFIKTTGAMTTGLALSSFTGASLLSSCDETGEGIKTFGLQLYSLRDDMPKDPRGVLKQVASFGYKQIESYQHKDLGIFWGMSAKDFKKYLDDLGLSILSTHHGVINGFPENRSDFEKTAAECAEIGMKYIFCPWLGAQKTIDDYKKKAELFNQCGDICKKAGLRFGYHNHEYSFQTLEGQLPQDVLMQNTDPALVDFEMDIYWVVTSGQDPEAWFKKYPNRFRVCHVKDRMKNTSEREATCTLGEGIINFPKILKTAKATGMEYYVVEHERYDGTTPLKAVEADAAYMKKFRM